MSQAVCGITGIFRLLRVFFYLIAVRTLATVLMAVSWP